MHVQGAFFVKSRSPCLHCRGFRVIFVISLKIIFTNQERLNAEDNMDAVNKENAPKPGRKHRILAVLLPLAAFVLELLPLGAVLRFGHMQTETGSVIYR